MNGLVVQASQNATSKFAMGVTNVTKSETIYGLVQCSEDLSSRDCARCLNTSISKVANCSYGRDAGRILQPSCVLWYEVYKFFESDPLPSLPSPSNTTDITKGKGEMDEFYLCVKIKMW
ncbi:non-specific protein-tyrosine kinase [Ranunculus cassubicifolius]